MIGAAFLFLSNMSGTHDIGDAAATFNGTGADDKGGWCVAGAGDITGDGLLDLAVTSAKADGESTNSGVVFLIPGFGI